MDRWIPIILSFGGLVFWTIAMYTMGTDVPIYYRLFAVSFMWLIVGLAGLNRR
jgi:hypothetical protein